MAGDVQVQQPCIDVLVAAATTDVQNSAVPHLNLALERPRCVYLCGGLYSRLSLLL